MSKRIYSIRTFEEIYHEHEGERLTNRQIANIVGCCIATVSKYKNQCKNVATKTGMNGGSTYFKKLYTVEQAHAYHDCIINALKLIQNRVTNIENTNELAQELVDRYFQKLSEKERFILIDLFDKISNKVKMAQSSYRDIKLIKK